MILARMGSDWLHHHLDNCTMIWNDTIARLIAFVLVAVLGCRKGDVTRSIQCKGLDPKDLTDAQRDDRNHLATSQLAIACRVQFRHGEIPDQPWTNLQEPTRP